MKTIIKALIDKKAEGDYWDYKEKWYSKNIDMLHDIICMANNLEDRDAYIIIGVNNVGSIVGVSSEGRKKQQDVINFLSNVPFAGENRPKVYVHTLEIQNKEIDVLEIKRTISTPYFLNEDYKKGGILYKSHIYTRIGDTNTPKDKTADTPNTEWLWKKRLFTQTTITTAEATTIKPEATIIKPEVTITKSETPIKEKFLTALDNLSSWHFETEYKGYYTLDPNFKINIIPFDFDTESRVLKPERILFLDNDYFQNKLELVYNNTIIFETVLHNYDGGKKVFPGYDFAKSGYFCDGFDVPAPCYIMDDYSGKLLKLWTDNTERDYALRGNPYLKDYNAVLGYKFLIFENKDELNSFNDFACNSKLTIKEINEKINDSDNVFNYYSKIINQYNSEVVDSYKIAEDYIYAMINAKLLYDKWIK